MTATSGDLLVGSLPGPSRPTWMERFNPVVLTILAIFSALVFGAILIVITDDSTLSAWSHLFSHPGTAFSTTWNLVETAYSALFTGALGSPSAYAHAFSSGHSSAFVTAFTPIS
jgi:general nucleoside transport system permease protein